MEDVVMKKIYVIVCVLLLLFAVSVMAQHVHTSTQAYTQGHSDSTGFSETYYFDIPERAHLDVSAQLIMWLNSTDGDPHVSINYKYAYKISNYEYADSDAYKLSGNNTELSSDFSTSGVSTWTIAPHANDDPENAADSTNAWNAIVITIAGASGNRADTEYALTTAWKLQDE